MAAKSKGNRIIIKMRSESGFCYFTMKNKMNTTDKLRLKKYDPKLRKRVEFVEGGKLK
jgi:large subunit ribosomal protein L33